MSLGKVIVEGGLLAGRAVVSYCSPKAAYTLLALDISLGIYGVGTVVSASFKILLESDTETDVIEAAEKKRSDGEAMVGSAVRGAAATVIGMGARYIL